MALMMVSIILPVYNGASHLAECINSVLHQTYPDFELLVLDDGSTDESVSIAEAFSDPRVRVIPCEHNFISTLNRGIDESKGQYIARIDCDDLMFPTRLQKQIDVMEHHTNISVCSTYAQTFGASNQIIGYGTGIVKNPLATFLLGNFVIHPSVMLRKSFLTTHFLRYKKYPYAEDYRLWIDVSIAKGSFYVISEPLIKYNINNSQVSQKYYAVQRETALRIQQETLELLLKQNKTQPVLLNSLCENLIDLNQHELVDSDEIFMLFNSIFTKMAV